MLGQYGQRGRWGRRGWGKSSYYGGPAGKQGIQRKIAKKKRKIEELTRDIQRLNLRLKSAPTPPKALIPTLRPPLPPAPKPPVPKAPPKPVLTESQKDARYLARNKDIAKAVKLGRFKSGRHHWKKHGRREGRVFDGLRPGFLAGFGGWWHK